MINLKTILTLVVGVLIGISFTKLFQSSSKEILPVASIKKLNPSVLEKQTVKATQGYQQQIDSLNVNSNALNKQLENTKQILATVKKKNIILQTQVYDLIDNKKNGNDTLQDDKNCAALENKVLELMQSSNEKDSLCETVATVLETQVKNKDSTLLIEGLKFITLQTAFNESLSQQGILYEQNKSYQKQFNRQKLKGKLLSVGVLIVAGLLANQLILH